MFQKIAKFIQSIGLFICIYGIPLLAKEPGLLEKYYHNQAAEILNKEELGDSFELLMQAVEAFPESPLLHFDLGFSQLKSGSVDLALRSFSVSETLSQKQLNLSSGSTESQKQKMEELAQLAAFHQGFIWGEKKEKEKAIQAYQRVINFGYPLDFTLVKAAKHNIELLMQEGGQGGKGDSKGKNDSPDENKDKKFAPNDPKNNSQEKLSESEVQKILKELKQQEDRIRAQYNRQNRKDEAREKNW